MICNKCGKECHQGIIETHKPFEFDRLTLLPPEIVWIPEDQKDKFLRKGKVSFEPSEGIGYYCPDCDKLYVEFSRTEYNFNQDEQGEQDSQDD